MSVIDNLKHEHGDPLRIVIRTNGTMKVLDRPQTISEACAQIGADTLDTVILADAQHVMQVDDTGVLKELPINDVATRLYRERCRPGTTHEIHGDIVILPDGDFASGNPFA